jgi:hypothetical protein
VKGIVIALILAAVLPTPGTQFHELPKGPGREEVESACYACHSADLLVQQRLTEKQWTATVEKMMRWGAVVEESKKSVVIQYLSRNFGPTSKFTPIVVKSAGPPPQR